MKRPLALLAAASLIGSLAAAIPAATSAATTGPMVSVAALLAQLPVVAEHNSGYDRTLFDYGIDADHDGCITRKEVLIRDAITLDKVSASCAVYGTWTSLYDNVTTTNPYALEVDHLVPLAEAWYSGAYAWTHQQQVAFGNDVGYAWDLQAVTSSLNQSKGAGDPADWMPPQNQCTYIAAWVGVKYRWHLAMDTREKATLMGYLTSCENLQVEQPGEPDLVALSGIAGTSTPLPPLMTPAPPVTTPAPPVTTPAPPVVTPDPPVVTPAPPVVHAKHPTALTLVKARRVGERLTLRVRLVDRATHHRIFRIVKLQRKTATGWKSIKSVRTSKATTLTTPRATYRVRFGGSSLLAASTSKSFRR